MEAQAEHKEIDFSSSASPAAVGYLYQNLLQTLFLVLGITKTSFPAFEHCEIVSTVLEGVEDVDVYFVDETCLHIQVKTSKWAETEVVEAFSRACTHFRDLPPEEQGKTRFLFLSLQASDQQVQAGKRRCDVKFARKYLARAIETKLKKLWLAARKQAGLGEQNKKKRKTSTVSKVKVAALEFLGAWGASFDLEEDDEEIEEEDEEIEEEDDEEIEGEDVNEEEDANKNHIRKNLAALEKASPSNLLKDISNRRSEILSLQRTLLSLDTELHATFDVQCLPLWNDVRSRCVVALRKHFDDCPIEVAKTMFAVLLEKTCTTLAVNEHHVSEAGSIENVGKEKSGKSRMLQVSSMSEELNKLRGLSWKKLQKDHKSALAFVKKFAAAATFHEHEAGRHIDNTAEFVSLCARVLQNQRN